MGTMTLTDRARALVADIDAVSKLPLLSRAIKAEALVRESGALLLDVVVLSERTEAAFRSLHAEINTIIAAARIAKGNTDGA